MYLKISLCGVSFSLAKATLIKYPETVLGKLAISDPKDKAPKLGLCDSYIPETSEYYFLSPPEHFTWVLAFYQSGVLHRPPKVCSLAYNSEVYFWGILPHYQDRICTECFESAVFQERAAESTGKHPLERRITFTGTNFFREIEHPDTTCCQMYAHVKKHIWEILENPEHSKYALGFTFLSIGFIMVSLCIVIIETLPQFHEKVCSGWLTGAIMQAENLLPGSTNSNTSMNRLPPHNILNTLDSIPNANSSNESQSVACGEVYYTIPVAPLKFADTVCLIFFTVEFVLRLWSTQCGRWSFLRMPMTLIDLCAILPFLIEKILEAVSIKYHKAVPIQRVLQQSRIIRVMRVFRALRVLKLVRYSTDLQIIGKTLRRSSSELMLILASLFMTTIMFSTVIYYAELGEPETQYTSIPEAMWWSIATNFMYGDAPPKTFFGRIVATLGFGAGVMLLAFPISVLVDNFSSIYQEDHNANNKKPKRIKKRLFTLNPFARAAVFL